jgi:carboxymethylenebutenolidase
MLTERQEKMLPLFDSHVGAELAGDLDTTIATMCDTPHLHHVPTMVGGVG